MLSPEIQVSQHADAANSLIERTGEVFDALRLEDQETTNEEEAAEEISKEEEAIDNFGLKVLPPTRIIKEAELLTGGMAIQQNAINSQLKARSEARTTEETVSATQKFEPDELEEGETTEANSKAREELESNSQVTSDSVVSSYNSASTEGGIHITGGAGADILMSSEASLLLRSNNQAFIQAPILTNSATSITQRSRLFSSVSEASFQRSNDMIFQSRYTSSNSSTSYTTTSGANVNVSGREFNTTLRDRNLTSGSTLTNVQDSFREISGSREDSSRSTRLTQTTSNDYHIVGRPSLPIGTPINPTGSFHGFTDLEGAGSIVLSPSSTQWINAVRDGGVFQATNSSFRLSSASSINTTSQSNSTVTTSTISTIAPAILSFAPNINQVISGQSLSLQTLTGGGFALLNSFSFVGPIAQIFAAVTSIASGGKDILSYLNLPFDLPIPPLPESPGGYTTEDLEQCLPEEYRDKRAQTVSDAAANTDFNTIEDLEEGATLGFTEPPKYDYFNTAEVPTIAQREPDSTPNAVGTPPEPNSSGENSERVEMSNVLLLYFSYLNEFEENINYAELLWNSVTVDSDTESERGNTATSETEQADNKLLEGVLEFSDLIYSNTIKESENILSVLETEELIKRKEEILKLLLEDLNDESINSINDLTPSHYKELLNITPNQATVIDTFIKKTIIGLGLNIGSIQASQNGSILLPGEIPFNPEVISNVDFLNPIVRNILLSVNGLTPDLLPTYLKDLFETKPTSEEQGQREFNSSINSLVNSINSSINSSSLQAISSLGLSLFQDITGNNNRNLDSSQRREAGETIENSKLTERDLVNIAQENINSETGEPNTEAASQNNQANGSNQSREIDEGESANTYTYNNTINTAMGLLTPKIQSLTGLTSQSITGITSVLSRAIINKNDSPEDLEALVKNVLKSEGIVDIDRAIESLNPIIQDVKAGRAIDILSPESLNILKDVLPSSTYRFINDIDNVLDNVGNIIGTVKALSNIPEILNIFKEHEVPALTQITSIMGCLDIVNRANDILAIIKNPFSDNNSSRENFNRPSLSIFIPVKTRAEYRISERTKRSLRRRRGVRVGSTLGFTNNSSDTSTTSNSALSVLSYNPGIASQFIIDSNVFTNSDTGFVFSDNNVVENRTPESNSTTTNNSTNTQSQSNIQEVIPPRETLLNLTEATLISLIQNSSSVDRVNSILDLFHKDLKEVFGEQNYIEALREIIIDYCESESVNISPELAEHIAIPNAIKVIEILICRIEDEVIQVRDEVEIRQTDNSITQSSSSTPSTPSSSSDSSNSSVDAIDRLFGLSPNKSAFESLEDIYNYILQQRINVTYNLLDLLAYIKNHISYELIDFLAIEERIFEDRTTEKILFYGNQYLILYYSTDLIVNLKLIQQSQVIKVEEDTEVEITDSKVDSIVGSLFNNENVLLNKEVYLITIFRNLVNTEDLIIKFNDESSIRARAWHLILTQDNKLKNKTEFVDLLKIKSIVFSNRSMYWLVN